jgi:pilus assembly protein Flp/PilA
MRKFTEIVFSIDRDNSGQDLIEYALVAGFIGLGAIAAMTGLSTAMGSAFARVGSALTSAV